uniref:uncharacterized protein LOC122609747 n=1 Tax=Erigeron canadensis TaxID=72917 RepID=UPI001CB8DC96|nr:uncharacterized protein LOC122609747 [Erigeron canadensis]
MGFTQHCHPLRLIDLQPNFPHYAENYDSSDDDDDGDQNLSTPKKFRCRRCSLCSKEINWFNRYYYECTHSCDYSLHKFCGDLPLTLKHKSHPFHTLTLTYSFWCYCNRLIKNYKDSDHPNLLHLPFPDESYNMLKHLFFKEIGYGTSLTTSESNLRNFHQHPLILVHTSECNDISKPSSSRTNNVVSCHNPMKKIELLCNGCVRPITSMPYYKCANDNENCDFVLHEWCTRFPIELKNYPNHPHTLKFHPKVPNNSFSIFNCDVCGLWGNGFAYSCLRCNYHIDVKCGFIPEKITHEAHPNHVLSRVQKKNHYPNNCRLCLKGSYWDPFSFLCHTCNVFIHVNCALLLPREIRHKCDKHPLSLSYFPVENYKGEYYCEVCEEEFDPQRCFYHCYKCDQSIHASCAPIISEFERARYEGIYRFINIKFGGIHKIKGHPHPLLFAQGIKSDGRCAECGYRLEYEIILRCPQCNFAINVNCCLKFIGSTPFYFLHHI